MLPLPPHNFIMFELDFDVNFPLLRLLLFLSDLKSTITRQQIREKIKYFYVNNFNSIKLFIFKYWSFALNLLFFIFGNSYSILASFLYYYRSSLAIAVFVFYFDLRTKLISFVSLFAFSFKSNKKRQLLLLQYLEEW